MFIRRDYFNQYIHEIIENIQSGKKVKYDQTLFDKSFLKTATHSPDNLKAIQYIEYGETVNEDPYGFPKTFSLKIKGKNISLSNIAAELEFDDIVNFLAPKFTSLSHDEISAAMRVITMLLMGFEIDFAEDD